MRIKLMKKQIVKQGRTIRYYILILSVFFFISCNRDRIIPDKKALLNHYNQPEDSLKREAISFLSDNMIDQKSEILIPFYKIVPDGSVIDNEFLLEDIDLAFEHWNRYPWADQVPFDIFLNYLLPYKVYGEEPAHWRSYFSQKYQDTVNAMMRKVDMDSLMRSTNEIYYHFLVNDLGQWFIYKSDPVKLTKYPGFNELMMLKSGDCFDWSYLSVMILRSLGIPSSVDFVPFWGRKNGTHYSEVFWDNKQQKFMTAAGRDFKFPAKVLRYTFRKQNIWTDSIQPRVKRAPFITDFLQHDHWLDATHEHTSTAAVDYNYNTSSDFAYICVFNYGRWYPVYWGRVDNKKIRFENMGTGILYRIAVPRKDTYEIISPAFLLDEKGNKIFFKPERNKKINLRLSKLNTGAKSWIEKGHDYRLYYSGEKSDWVLFQTKKSEQDSLIVFEGVPSGTLYWLLDAGQTKRLERIFTYETSINHLLTNENDEQIFW